MYLHIILVGTITNYLISLFLSCRQLRALQNGKLSPLLVDRIQNDEFKKMKLYNMVKLVFSIFNNTFFLLKSLCYVYMHIIPRAYEHMEQFTNIRSKLVLEIMFTLAFMHSERIMEIPFDLFQTFFIEERFGFNKMTLSIFVIDFLKETAVLTLLVCPLYMGLYKIIGYFNTFFIVAFIFVGIFQIILVVIYPIWIQPLFNKFKELEDGPLKNKIRDLADRIRFRINKIFVMDGSMRSNHSNAYFTGLVKEKRIVLFDTLLKQTTEDEIIAILGHEMGHWHHNHVPKLLTMQLFTQLIFLYFLEVALKNKFFVISLFSKEDVPVIIKLIYFSFFMNILSPFFTLLINMYSRYNERQADLFSIRLGLGRNLANGLISLHKKNKSNLCLDWMYSTYYHSHPTLIERLEFIEDEETKMRSKEK